MRVSSCSPTIEDGVVWRPRSYLIEVKQGVIPMQGHYEVTAAEMAKAAGIDPKAFRKGLRDEQLPWHHHYDRWTVREGSPEHRDMLRVSSRLTRCPLTMPSGPEIVLAHPKSI